jgi:hypothetical protein
MFETFLVYAEKKHTDLRDRLCRDHGARALTIDEWNSDHFFRVRARLPDAAFARSRGSAAWFRRFV